MRLFGARKGHASEQVETFLTDRVEAGLWRALVRPGRKLLPGTVVEYGDGLSAEVLEKTDMRGGRLLRLSVAGAPAQDEFLESHAVTPLPPYIKQPLAKERRDLYQTVYAARAGSAAAPTAGLHFTHDLLNRIAARGAQIARITLHVGPGTFRPIDTDDIRAHTMHAEHVSVTQEAADIINGARGRVIAIGTTSARAIESAAAGERKVGSLDGQTSLYITPEYSFQVVDALVTNFHMPRSTLLVLVSAFSGIENIRGAYREALAKGYRFLSFGDAMLIL
jgi:S-adenosylmethionine:tRNA ribosyltransferase-isomerase